MEREEHFGRVVLHYETREVYSLVTSTRRTRPTLRAWLAGVRGLHETRSSVSL